MKGGVERDGVYLLSREKSKRKQKLEVKKWLKEIKFVE